MSYGSTWLNHTINGHFLQPDLPDADDLLAEVRLLRSYCSATAGGTGRAMSFNEMFAPNGSVRAPYARVEKWLENLGNEVIERALRESEARFRRQGITFAVYGDDKASERLIPFDIVPRIFSATEWRRLSAGIEQRVRAMNAFLHDLYHRQEILRAGRIPYDVIIQNDAFVPEMVGVNPVKGIYAHIMGIDIVRVNENEFYVLEDNCRTPSGVSYMLEDREAMMFLFPELFAQQRVAPVENYPAMLRKTLDSVAPSHHRERTHCRGADARHSQLGVF